MDKKEEAIWNKGYKTACFQCIEILDRLNVDTIIKGKLRNRFKKLIRNVWASEKKRPLKEVYSKEDF